jgi:NADH-quinone oxidoreductase subunit J
MGVITDFIGDIWGILKEFAFYLLDNLDLVAFLVLAVIMVLAAIYVVTDKEVVHSAFYLALVFLCVGFVYFFLEAEFIGVVQILVYVGAITILFAFSIMLTRRYIMKGGDSDE